MRNARFWFWINGGWVKITLKPGQSLSHYIAWSHDEGWSSESNQWTHQGDSVECSWAMDGKDCDGRLTRHGELNCSLCCLDSISMSEDDEGNIRPGNEGIFVPDWQKASSGQRDYAAEAAGY
jgi:hypothetical protein